MKKMDNKGFSLVELIVIVLILAIIAGAATAAISSVTDMDAERAQSRVITAFNTARNYAMNGGDDTTGSEKTYYAAIFNYEGKLMTGAFMHEGDFGTNATGLKADLNVDKPVFEPVALGNYKLTAELTYKNGSNAAGLVNDGDIVIYAFHRVIGNIDASKSSANGDYVNIKLVGSDTKEMILAKATGRLYEK